MKVGSYQTIRLIYPDQLRGKILPMPDGEQSTCYLMEIIEEFGEQPDQPDGKSNIGCMVIVPKDLVFKYSKKESSEKTEVQGIFDVEDVLVQYQDIKDPREFYLDYGNDESD